MQFGGSIGFFGNGTATFNFNGGFTGRGDNIQKYGSSTLVIAGPTNVSGGQFSLAGGTIRLSGSGTLGGEAVKFFNAGTVLDLNGTNQVGASP